MTPIGAAGSGSGNIISTLRDAKAKVTAKKAGISSYARSQAPSAIEELFLSRDNEFEQRIEEDGLPTTVIYDAFGRFRRAILPKGKLIDIYV